MTSLFPDEFDSPTLFLPATLISGGQTGVDRAILDWAIANGVPHGGWCPAGRRAEDGPLPDKYQLTPMNSPRYADRTRQNVIDSDATLIFCQDKLTGGTALTASLAAQHLKSHRIVVGAGPRELERTMTWLRRVRPHRLNVAGPRASTSPGIYQQAYGFFDALWGESLAARRIGSGD